MSKLIFVNLPVTDLERSKRFYEALGARNEPKFSNEQAGMMVLSDTIHVMLLTHDFYKTFTSKPIGDAHATSQVLIPISSDSPTRCASNCNRSPRSSSAHSPRSEPQVPF